MTFIYHSYRAYQWGGGKRKSNATWSYLFRRAIKNPSCVITAPSWSIDRTVLLEQTFQDHPVQLPDRFWKSYCWASRLYRTFVVYSTMHYFQIMHPKAVFTGESSWKVKHQFQVSRVSTLFLSVEPVNSSQEDRTTPAHLLTTFAREHTWAFFSGRHSNNASEAKAKRLQSTGCKALS